MAKVTRKTKTVTTKSSAKNPKTWFEQLDAAAVNEALEEATVDAYDDHEQHTGLLSAIGDELVFPFAASVLGESVEVVGIEWPKGDSFGLDLVCERNGKQHCIEARSVDLVTPLPEGHLFLAAYLEWKKRL